MRLTRSPQEAAEFILKGELVAFPTETVYGLGASLWDETALRKVFDAKGRPSDNPLIVHIVGLDQLDSIAATIPKSASILIRRFFPGPLTLVLPKHPRVPLLATAGLETVAVRMPRLDLAQEFLGLCGVPVAAPSANLSGRPSPTTWEAVKTDLDGRIACILVGDQTEVGLESTVVDCTGEPPMLLRSGAVTLEQLREIVPEITLAAEGTGAARSPGLKHHHYSPQAKVVLVDRPPQTPGERSAYIGLDKSGEFALSKNCKSVEEYARELFLFFRRCDSAGIARIYCQTVSESGIGLALMDRLKRASE
jgi:L-threonylcarbamoyladenylate synthase